MSIAMVSPVAASALSYRLFPQTLTTSMRMFMGFPGPHSNVIGSVDFHTENSLGKGKWTEK